MTRKLAILVGVAATAWVCTLLLGFYWSAIPGPIEVSVAAAIGTVPAAVTLCYHERMSARDPEGVLSRVLGGTLVRMAVVLGCGLSAYFGSERFHKDGFLLAVVAFYLLTLLVETILILPREDHRRNHDD